MPQVHERCMRIAERDVCGHNIESDQYPAVKQSLTAGYFLRYITRQKVYKNTGINFSEAEHESINKRPLRFTGDAGSGDS